MHLMIDLETIGNKSSSAILSIGLALFNKSTVVDTFYAEIDVQSQLDKNLKINFSALQWWMKQSKEAQAVYASTSRTPVIEALNQIKEFLNKNNVKKKSLKVWGNGAAFDIPILENLYDAFQQEIPWEFWNVRCYRTLKDITDWEKLVERVGTHHNALHDSIYQAKCVMAYCKIHPEMAERLKL